MALHWVELIHPTAGQLHGSARGNGASEGPFVSGFKAPFDHDGVLAEDHVVRDVTVSRKTGHKGAHKLVSEGGLSI